MKRILIVGLTENPGGMESFVLNYYKHIDNKRFHIDFLVNYSNPIAFENEFKDLGSNIFHVTPRSQNPIAFYKETHQFFKLKSKQYDVIWLNVCSLANIDYLKLAKKYGIKTRIIHSHNSQNMDTKLRGFLHKRNRKHISKYATHFWACSQDAANYFYNNENIEKSVIIPNAVDVFNMQFNSEQRRLIRTFLEWENNVILGHIGRLHFQKNQSFLLELFSKLVKKDDSLRLVLVGEGSDRKKLEESIQKLNLEHYVKLVGIQVNISAWLSAFDMFIFPSLFEGLPIAALEAQANGIPILASKEALTDSGVINENVVVKELTDSLENWMIAFEKAKKSRISYDIIKNNFEKTGYEIKTATKNLEKKLDNLL